MTPKRYGPRPEPPLGTHSHTSTALALWRQWLNGVEDGILAFKTEVWSS